MDSHNSYKGVRSEQSSANQNWLTGQYPGLGL